MQPKRSLSLDKHKERARFRMITSFLVLVSTIAIAFSILVIQIQSGATGYLAGLSIWSRGQLETVRYSAIYARNGDPIALKEALDWYQVPISYMQARALLEMRELNFERASKRLKDGGSHEDDIPRMVWMFRLLRNAPNFQDAVEAWEKTDKPLVKLGDIIQQLQTVRAQQPLDREALDDLQEQLNQVNRDLSIQAEVFRHKMSQASRALVTILSVVSLLFFLLLTGVAAFLIYKLLINIRRSAKLFRNTFEQAAIGIVQINSEWRIIQANPAMCAILKTSEEKLLGVTFENLIQQKEQTLFAEEQKALSENEVSRICVKQRLKRQDGSSLWAKVTLSRGDVSGVADLRFIGIIEDVSEQHRLSEELSYQARHDSLTGLINRRAFEGYLEDALVTAKSEKFVHALCFIDMDQFKIINDTVGHHAGDQLLLQVTQTLSKQLRKSDLLARLGGDEFALILDCCEPDDAVALADKLLAHLNDNPFVWEGRSFNIGCSIGIVPIMASSGEMEELLQIADSACQMAKEQGRNRVLLTYQDDTELIARKEQMEWLERIRHAIDNDRLYLDVQKIVGRHDDELIRLEVLLRMRGENNEVIPPGAFLPAAERFGLAHLLDRWVIRHVCSFFQLHQAALAKIDAVHINISGRSFDHEDFAEFTLNVIDQFAMPASKLCFEITETAAISNLTDVQEFIHRLNAIGSTFALDDFGAGLSSFAYLKQLPVDILKIDGAFVKNMAKDETDCAMVRAIADIGRTLNKAIVAEFVEDEVSLQKLHAMGVEYSQGFYLHRPEAFATFFDQSELS